MQRLFQFAVVGISALALTGCATIDVGSHIERGLNFTQYRTYDWGQADALPRGDPRLDKNGFFRDHIEGEIDKQLAEKGFERSTSGAPDLLIHYHASVTRRIDVNRQDGYCGTEDYRVHVLEHEAATLVFDVIDARTDRLIWRGWARHRIDGIFGNPPRMARTIHEAVTRTLKRLPGAS